jgi:methylenetetrahydrofolate dehydrogenase (NADP+)/methenyltetrahydrofolate cyclohydrolase
MEQPLILDGKKAREFFSLKLKEKVSLLGFKLSLAILQIGDLEKSNAYINSKIKFANGLGVGVYHKKFSENCLEEDVVSEIEKLNEDKNCNGIILQLPIPQRFNKEKLLNLIATKKDVDGLSFESKKRRSLGEYAPYPATARGVKELLDFYGADLLGKKVAVLGRSILAGGPIAEIVSASGGLVTVCHSQTVNEEDVTKKSEIIIVAIGKPNFLNKSFFNNDRKQIVIDVGINRVAKDDISKLKEEVLDYKLVGDVDFNEVKSNLFGISPVPGGVGQMTVLALFENLYDLAVFNKG